MLIGEVTSTYLNSDAEQRQGCSEHVKTLKSPRSAKLLASENPLASNNSARLKGPGFPGSLRVFVGQRPFFSSIRVSQDTMPHKGLVFQLPTSHYDLLQIVFPNVHLLNHQHVEYKVRHGTNLNPCTWGFCSTPARLFVIHNLHSNWTSRHAKAILETRKWPN